jgi:DNA-binding response OmpR family regulator
VLIVDGSSASRAAMGAALSALAVQIEEAGDGAAAFGLLLEKPFDVMITDLNLVPVDGSQLLLAARLLAASRRPRIIVCLSACDASNPATQSTLQSADRVLPKPVSGPVLISAVSSLLPQEGKGSNRGLSAM